jgi:hypothetical protein
VLVPTFRIKDPEEQTNSAKDTTSVTSFFCNCYNCVTFLQVLVPTFRIKDPEEQKKARQELAEGALKEKLTLLNKLVVSGCDFCIRTCCHVGTAAYNSACQHGVRHGRSW